MSEEHEHFSLVDLLVFVEVGHLDELIYLGHCDRPLFAQMLQSVVEEGNQLRFLEAGIVVQIVLAEGFIDRREEFLVGNSDALARHNIINLHPAAEVQEFNSQIV